MKKLLAPFFALVLVALFTAGCEKPDMKIKKLNHGDGTWTITSIHYEYYDSTGSSVVADSTVLDAGEIVVFNSTTLNALWGYRLCVANMNESTGVEVYPCEIFFDEARVNFQPTVNGEVPPSLYALWTVNESSRRKQEWSTFELRGNGTLYSKRTIKLKFDKR
jgi:hypothetical protein